MGHALGVVEFSPELSLTEFEVDMVELPDTMPFYGVRSLSWTQLAQNRQGQRV